MCDAVYGPTSSQQVRKNLPVLRWHVQGLFEARMLVGQVRITECKVAVGTLSRMLFLLTDSASPQKHLSLSQGHAAATCSDAKKLHGPGAQR